MSQVQRRCYQYKKLPQTTRKRWPFKGQNGPHLYAQPPSVLSPLTSCSITAAIATPQYLNKSVKIWLLGEQGDSVAAKNNITTASTISFHNTTTLRFPAPVTAPAFQPGIVNMEEGPPIPPTPNKSRAQLRNILAITLEIYSFTMPLWKGLGSGHSSKVTPPRGNHIRDGLVPIIDVRKQRHSYKKYNSKRAGSRKGSESN